MKHIDEIIVLNLPEHIEKKWAIIGAYASDPAADPHKIRFWEAIPANTFKNVSELLIEIEKDGFGFLKYHFEETYADRAEQSYGDSPYTNFLMRIYAQAWSYCQVLRFIIEKNICAIFTYDDWYIGNMFELYHYVEWLIPDPEFKMLQLSHYPVCTFNPLIPIVTCPNIPSIVEGPLGGCENAMVYTPEGAKFFLDFLEREGNFYYNVENTLAKIGFLPSDLRQGIWTLLKPIAHPFSFDMGSTIHDYDISKTLDGTKTSLGELK